MRTSADAVTPCPVGHRDADRRADPDLLALDRKGLGEAQDDRIGERGELVGLRLICGSDDLELVAAQPPDLPLVADDLGQPPRDLLQQLIADRMAQRVVDRLEPVEIEQQQRARLRAARYGCAARVRADR